MSSSDELHFEKNRRIDKSTDVKRRRYTKWKLLELRKSKKCQEWPKVLNKRFIGVDGKWDPVGAFESNSFPSRSQSRDDRPRDDYKPYYYYGDNSKRYNSYSSNHSYYFSNSKSKYDYDDGNVYDSSRKRLSPSDYYPNYYPNSNKPRNLPDKEINDSGLVDNKPEWFTGGPSNINETIELSGMSRELEAGILKTRSKNMRRNEDDFMKSNEIEENYTDFKDDDPAQIDSHLLKIIKNNAKEKDKRKTTSSAKEVEKVLKSILLRPQDETKETNNPLPPNSNGVVRTVNEIEANLKLKGNRGAGDMSAYYKLLGLVQNNYDQNHVDPKVSSEKPINHTETSTNNNHPRQFTNSKYPVSTLKSTKHYIKLTDELEIDNFNNKAGDNITNIPTFDDTKVPSKDIKVELDNINYTMNNSIKNEETGNQTEAKKSNGFNNFNNARSERLNMNSRGVCNPLSGQFSNHMLGGGQNAYRWIRAMNNAAAASARITQMNQSEHTSEMDQKVETKSEDNSFQPTDCPMESYNSMENSYRHNLETSSNPSNQMGSYINSYNYMNPGAASMFNQMPVKPFFPYNFPQNSLFGRQFVNPYLLQQLFLHKQWENRNISLQNQIRQFQSMIFNCNSPQQPTPNLTAATPNNGYTAATTLPLNQGDCSAISVNK